MRRSDEVAQCLAQNFLVYRSLAVRGDCDIRVQSRPPTGRELLLAPREWNRFCCARRSSDGAVYRSFLHVGLSYGHLYNANARSRLSVSVAQDRRPAHRTVPDANTAACVGHDHWPRGPHKWDAAGRRRYRQSWPYDHGDDRWPWRLSSDGCWAIRLIA